MLYPISLFKRDGVDPISMQLALAILAGGSLWRSIETKPARFRVAGTLITTALLWTTTYPESL
jgi:hypothetical protein